MTLNEALIKQNFIVKILIKNEKCELSKQLKMKIMNMRIELTKIKNKFDSDCQEMIVKLKPEGFEDLITKENKTPEETEEFGVIIDKLNKEYESFLAEKGKEEVTFDRVFTQSEYEQIIDVNAGNDVTINGTELPATDFLEVIYSLFVE